MISEFRSVLAQQNAEDMVRDFEGAVNRSLYYMAEGLKGYKGWVPAFVAHSEEVPFGFLNLGYKNTLNVSASSQGVAIQTFEEMFTMIKYPIKNLYIGVISPDGKTGFIYARGGLLFDVFRKMLCSLSDMLGEPTLKKWAMISDKETKTGFQKRWENGDFEIPDLDGVGGVMETLGVSEEIARDMAKFIYGLEMEDVDISLAPIQYGRLDHSAEFLQYMTDLMHKVAPTEPLYNNMKSYQTF